MKNYLKTILIIAVAAGLFPTASSAQQPNLIINPGFEAGLIGYNNTGTNFTTIVNPHSGAIDLASGSMSTTLQFTSQTVTTSQSGIYRLSYFLNVPGVAANGFQVQSNGAIVYNQAGVIGTGVYNQNTLILNPGTNLTTLSFGLFYNAATPVNERLDDLALVLISFNPAGLTPNQVAILNPINSSLANNNDPGFLTIVNGLINAPNSALGGDLDQLSPEKFGYFTSVTAFNNASFETVAMDNYLASQRGTNGSFLAGNGTIDTSGLTMNDPSYDPGLAMVHSRMMAFNAAPVSNGLISDVANPMLAGVEMKDMKDSKDMKEMAPVYTNPWNFFVRGNVILAQGFSQTDLPHFDDNTESVTLGTDYRICPNFLVGLTASYAHTDVTLDNFGSSATVDSYSPGLYASYADKGWYANVTGNYLHNAYTEARSIAFIGQTANGAPEGNEGVANLDGGYDFHKGGFTFGPLAGVQYTHLSVDGFNESGSAADLAVNSQDSDSLRSRLGGHVSYAFSNHGMTFTPHIGATWQHEFLDQSRGITSQFNGFGGGSFAVRTPNPSRDSALADAGFDVDITHTVSVFADYIAQAGQDNYFGQSVQAGVKIGF